MLMFIGHSECLLSCAFYICCSSSLDDVQSLWFYFAIILTYYYLDINKVTNKIVLCCLSMAIRLAWLWLIFSCLRMYSMMELVDIQNASFMYMIVITVMHEIYGYYNNPLAVSKSTVQIIGMIDIYYIQEAFVNS